MFEPLPAVNGRGTLSNRHFVAERDLALSVSGTTYQSARLRGARAYRGLRSQISPSRHGEPGFKVPERPSELDGFVDKPPYFDLSPSFPQSKAEFCIFYDPSPIFGPPEGRVFRLQSHRLAGYAVGIY